MTAVTAVTVGTLAASLSSVPSAYAAAGGSSLSAGQELQAGQELVSPGGQYTLAMQTDGNLVVYGNGCVIWASNTAGTGSHDFLAMQADGNLVIYTSAGKAVWNSKTAGTGSQNSVEMQVDGNLVVYTSALKPVWASGASAADQLCAPDSMSAGKYLHSPSGQYKLNMQTDGNLVVYDNGTAIWASNTGGTGSTDFLAMQADGNLVVYTSAGKAVWNSVTGGSGSKNTVVMQNDGNLVVYTSSGKAVWNSKAAGWNSGSSGSTSGSGSGAVTSTESRAVSWAKSMIGAASGKSGGAYYFGCLAFAVNAYVVGADYPIRNDISVSIGNDTYPSQVWSHFRTGTTGTGTPPAGALVFWDSTGGTDDSHVAVSVGNGELVSTNVATTNIPGYNGIHYETMAQFAANSWNIYKGWWLPDK